MRADVGATITLLNVPALVIAFGWQVAFYFTGPLSAVGSVIGIGDTMGALGGMGIALCSGYILVPTQSYEVLFSICASAFALALVVLHLLYPKRESVKVS